MHRQPLKRFLGDRRGNALVEFGLIAPLIAGVIALIGEGAALAYSLHGMRGGVHSGAQYVMGGSRSVGDIKAVVMSSWPGKPEGANATVTQFFKCGASAGTEGVLCSDQKLPSMYFKIRAQADYEGLWDTPLAAQQIIRVR